MHNALVLGGSGLVGGKIASALLRSGYSVDFTYFGNPAAIPNAKGHRLDICDGEALRGLVGGIRPDLIVNAASTPSVDLCERDPEMALKVNAEPQRIIVESAKPGACIAYISTSNVFGFSRTPLTEDDSPDPISAYGKAKLQGERYTAESGRHIILRSDQIYGWTAPKQKRTFVERTLRKLEDGEVVEVCSDWFNCPTFANDIAAAFAKLVANRQTGVFHAVGPTYLNRYDWAVRIAEVFGCRKELVKAISSSSLNLPAKRSNCALDNGKIVKASGVRFLSVDEALMLMRESRNIQRP